MDNVIITLNRCDERLASKGACPAVAGETFFNLRIDNYYLKLTSMTLGDEAKNVYGWGGSQNQKREASD